MLYAFSELKFVPYIIEDKNPNSLGLLKLKQNKFSDSTSRCDKWNHDLRITTDLLDQIGVSYVLVKNIDLPFAYMNDLDFLIEDEGGRELFKCALKKMNFNVQKRGLKRSDKFTAIGDYDESFGVEIDVYVDATWWTIRYASLGTISLKSIQVEKQGKLISVPCPTHDLFILITHSYWHGRVTLAEVSQITKILLTQKIDWNCLFSLAKKYHLQHPLYLYFTLVKDVFDLMDHVDVELENCIAMLKQKFLCRLLVNSVKKHNHSFPLHIPYFFKIVSSFDEILTSFSRNGVSYKEAESYLLCLLMCRRMETL